MPYLWYSISLLKFLIRVSKCFPRKRFYILWFYLPEKFVNDQTHCITLSDMRQVDRKIENLFEEANFIELTIKNNSLMYFLSISVNIPRT